MLFSSRACAAPDTHPTGRGVRLPCNKRGNDFVFVRRRVGFGFFPLFFLLFAVISAN